MPEITVAVTTHNLERYICTCVEEILGQTFSSFEILIYDDCSTDRTRALLAELQAEFPAQIRVICGEAPLKSPAKARNAILDSGLIKGKYIVFLDGDDRIEENFLEKLYAAAQKEQADIALCAYDRFEEGTGHVLCEEMRGFPAVISFPPERGLAAFINGSLWNKLISVECIGPTRLPLFSAGEDLSFLLALYDKCRRIACVDEALIHYRVRESSVISNIQEETVHQFAWELLRLRATTAQPWLKDTLELVAFIHIGISMPLRVYSNPDADISALLRWVSAYFRQNFSWFRGQRLLQLPALLRYGVKGAGVWAAKICYRAHCFRLFLWLYQTVTQRLHIDIKF